MPDRLYDEWLMERLKDPEEALAYLNAMVEHDEYDSDPLWALTTALKHVSAAMEKPFGAEHSFSYNRVVSQLDALGYKLAVVKK